MFKHPNNHNNNPQLNKTKSSLPRRKARKTPNITKSCTEMADSRSRRQELVEPDVPGGRMLIPSPIPPEPNLGDAGVETKGCY